MIKRYILLLIFFASILSCSLSVKAAYIEDYVLTIWLDGMQVVFHEQGPFLDQSRRVLVPARTVAEKLNADVQWDSHGTVSIQQDETKIELFINEKQALLNGNPVELDVKALLVQGKVMVPVRFIGEALDLNVTWDKEKKAVYLYTDSYDPETDPRPAPVKIKQELFSVTEKWGQLEVDIYYKMPEVQKEVIDYTQDTSGVYPIPAGELYTYYDMVDDLWTIVETYQEHAKLASIGRSVEGRDLWLVTVGKGPKNVLVVGASHAREWITTPILVEMARTYAADFQSGKIWEGLPVRDILEEYTFYFVPMANPDGVALAQEGISAFPHRAEELLEMNKPGLGYDFRRWKANIRGVDLNRQYDTSQWNASQDLFGTGARPIQTSPAWAYYSGPHPESEPETRALADLVRGKGFSMLLDYHSTGRVIFWYYGQKGQQLERDQAIVQAMSRYSGYPAESPRQKAANVSLNRWAVLQHGIPGICVEVTPYSLSMRTMSSFAEEINYNRYMLLAAVQALSK